MQSQAFWSTFITIFIAEMGDKTQFAALAASSKFDSKISVWLGVVLALGLAGTLGVAAGTLLNEYLNPKYLKLAAGVVFIVLGVMSLRDGFLPT